MSNEFIYPHKGIRIHRVNDAETRARAIRLYRASPGHWEFQLRAPMGVGFAGMRDGKDFVIAGASCSADDMRAVCDAIDAQIAAPSLGQRLAEIADILGEAAHDPEDAEWLALLAEIRKISIALRCCGKFETGSGEHGERA